MRALSTRMLVALVGLSLALTGCELITGSDETAENEGLPEAPDELNLVFGGFEATDEEAAFGDPVLLTEINQGSEDYVNDPVASDGEVLEMEDLPETDLYVLRIAWGQLDEDGKSQVDWSGTASVVSGAIVVRKTILFEPEDEIHRPRPDRRTLSWTSYTDEHMDGLALVIFDPHNFPTAETVVNQFTFETGPFTHTFSMDELAQIDTLITVDDAGNSIHFTGFKREKGPCRAGFTRGQWYRQGWDWGEFRGGWIDEEGELRGHIRGIWGYDEDGRNVLYGKYVDSEGNFMGLLEGTFGRAPTGAPMGAVGGFRGHWYDEDGEPQGVFRGQWKEARGRGPGGYFRAVWGQDCPGFDNGTGPL